MNKSMLSAKPGEGSPKDASKTSRDIGGIVKQLMMEEVNSAKKSSRRGHQKNKQDAPM